MIHSTTQFNIINMQHSTKRTYISILVINSTHVTPSREMGKVTN